MIKLNECTYINKYKYTYVYIYIYIYIYTHTHTLYTPTHPHDIDNYTNRINLNNTLSTQSHTAVFNHTNIVIYNINLLHHLLISFPYFELNPSWINISYSRSRYTRHIGFIEYLVINP